MSKILVVEDDRSTRLQIKRLLQLEGYEVDEAENGELGIFKALEAKPDLIVCDIMMPVLDGYGMLLRVRDNPQTRLIPFIFLTAKAQLEDLRKGMELGADDYLTKPLNPTNLFNSISRRLEKKAHQEAEAARQKEEVSLQIAATLPREINDTLDHIVSLSNLMGLKYSERDKQAFEITNALKSEVSTLRHYIRRIDLFSKLPQLYANRFEKGILDHVSTEANPEQIEQAAKLAAHRLCRTEDIVVNVTKDSLHIDEQFLEIIIEELVSNACNASETGTSIEVDIQSDSGLMTISVSDHGKGLEEEKIERLQSFSKFGQLSCSEGKTRLGLSLVQGIARLYGGEFSIEPKEDGGLVASVFLPNEPQS